MRGSIFDAFWRMVSWAMRMMYIRTLVDTVSQGRRKRFQWNLKTEAGERFEVCRTLVASTLGVSERTLTSWLGETKLDPKKDKAPKTGRQARISEEDGKFLETFIKAIPTVPSHYCRSSEAYADKKFFESDVTEADLYREYQTRAGETGHRVLSDCVFSKKLKAMDYSAFKPKKDQCSTCLAKKLGNIPEVEFQRHQTAARLAKEERQRDEERAARDPRYAVFTMDLQAVVCLPKTRAGASFYKTKLQQED
jgi:hypothetical protein